jgi:hypothetical protein
MEGISDIHIIGLDELRPPIIRKEPYIDLYFKLSHQAPADWCRDFNALLAQHSSSPKIKEKEGRFIESWVRTPDEIVALFDLLKQTVADCTQQYIDRIESAARHSSAGSMTSLEDAGEQGRLNRIIASLDFAAPTH